MAAGLAWPAQATAATTSFAPAADAYVDESAPKRKFGTALELLAGTTPIRRAYLRFDVAALPGPVVRATLRLQAATSSLAGYQVRGVADTTWAERTITYSTAPAVGTGVVASSGPIAAGSTSVDVTPLVSGNGQVSMALTSDGTTALSLASREAGATGPQLLVETQDTTAPVVTLTVPANGSTIKQTLPTFSGAAGTASGDASTVRVAVYQGATASGTPIQALETTRSGGSWSVPASSPLAEGVYTAQAEQSDDAGNLGRSAPSTFTVDTTAPSVTLTTPADGAITADSTPALAGGAGTAAGDSSSVTARIYSGTAATGTPVQTLTVTRSGGSWSTTAGTLPDGTYTARAEQADAAGNLGLSATSTFTVDATAPAVTLTTPANGSSGTTATPTFAGAAGTAAGDDPTVTVSVYAGATASGTPVQTLTTTRSAGTWSVAASAPLADGTYTARAAQSDAAGNTGLSAPSTFGVGSAPPPPASDYRALVMADGPRAYWRLGEASGTIARDETANGIAGSYLNGVALGRAGAVGGDTNTAIALDGVNDTVQVPNVAALNASGALTIEAWIKPLSLPATSATIARKEGQYLVRLSSSGAVVFRLWKGGAITETATASGAVGAGGWAHVAATWDGTTMQIYVNGTARASRALAAPADVVTRDLYLGSSYNSYDYYAGGLDEVAIYAAALSGTRVKAHYDAATSVDTVPPSPALVAPTSGSTMDARPNFGGTGSTAPGDAATVTVRVYSGTSASGTPVQSPAATIQPSGTFSVRASALASGTYTAVAEQADTAANVGRSQPSTFTVDAGGDPVILSAGDIAACDTFGDEATAALLDRLPGDVLTIGDHVYEYATASDFTNCYDPTWGRHKARTTPTIGDHEYLTADAAPYFSYFGAAAGDPAKGYYSHDIGAWHIVSLNEVCTEIGGCGAGSPEEQWLRADLAAHPAQCTLAILHKPRFSSGKIHGSSTTYQPFWQALYDFGAELVLSGDDHVYERFAPQTPAGAADPVRGIREIIAGTGGRSHYDFASRIEANSEVRNNDAFGVLQVTLHPNSYDWRFVPEAGKTFTDSGSQACH